MMTELTAGDTHSGLRREPPVAAMPGNDYDSQPEVAVFGEWDTENLGDRAIHVETLRFFAECGWRASSYSVGSLVPAKVQTVIETASPVVSRARSAALARLPRVKRALRALRQRHRMNRLLPRLAHVQAISVGGGGLLSDVNLHFPQSLAMLAEAARLLEKPLLCLGCSIDGAWSAGGGKKIREFLSACSVVAARDNVTAERIAGVLCRPVPVFGDFCLSEADVRNDVHCPHLRHGLAVNVCEMPAPWRAEQRCYEDALVALAHRLARKQGGSGGRQPIRIFTTGTADDTAAARRVFNRLAAHGAELCLPHNVDELTLMLRESAMAIASRLHASILALSEHTPVIGFSASPKLRNFLSTMQMGEYSFTLDESDRLAHWLEAADYAAILAKQRAAMRRAPAWAARTQIRRALVSIAAARSSTLRCT